MRNLIETERIYTSEKKNVLRRIIEEMINLVRAFQFLTIIPLSGKKINNKINNYSNDSTYVDAMSYFPLVGFLIGLIIAGCFFIFNRFISFYLACGMVVVLEIILSGSLHLDGLADTFDGFFSSSNKEEILKRMKDTNVGTFGMSAIFSLLILKFSLLISLPVNHLIPILFVFPALSRWSSVFSSFISIYPRHSGLGKLYIKDVGWKELVLSTIIALTIATAFFQYKGLILIGVILGFTTLFSLYSHQKIGGVTGDVLGAMIEINEVIILLFFLIVFKIF